VKKTALITGITGQDGSYLAELLLEKDYRVFGLVRPGNHFADSPAAHLENDIELLTGDLTDAAAIHDAVRNAAPDEVYNLGGQTFVPASWAEPEGTFESTGLGVVRLLEAIRSFGKPARLFQASTSEMFGTPATSPQRIDTPFKPRNLYGVAKVAAHWSTVAYRRHYDMYAVSGILFNHESPRRSVEFVTRKITRTVARIRHGRATELVMGDLDAQRDWGYAGDYVRAMWLMLQQDEPVDYIIGTGVLHSVRDFVELAFCEAGLNWQEYVRQDPALMRAPEPVPLVADAQPAREQLGWEPEVDFSELVRMMASHDLALEAERAH